MENKDMKNMQELYNKELNKLIQGLSVRTKDKEISTKRLTLEELVSVNNYRDIEDMVGVKDASIVELFCILYTARNILWGRKVVELGELGDNYTHQFGLIAENLQKQLPERSLMEHISMTVGMMYSASVATLFNMMFLPEDFDAIKFVKNPMEKFDGFSKNKIM